MAKQRRPSSNSSKTPDTSSSVRSAQPTGSPAVTPPPQPAAQGPQRRATYVEAVTLYERGMRALQGHDFEGAARVFESVLRLYPEEKELHERVRQYLNICNRQITPKEAAPQTLEERLYAATLAINGGRYDQALANLRRSIGR